MPDNKIKENRKKTRDVLANSITQFLYICDIFGASKTLAELMIEVTKDEKEGLISSKEAKDYKLFTLRELENAQKRCKCFEMRDIF